MSVEDTVVLKSIEEKDIAMFQGEKMLGLRSVYKTFKNLCIFF